MTEEIQTQPKDVHSLVTATYEDMTKVEDEPEQDDDGLQQGEEEAEAEEVEEESEPEPEPIAAPAGWNQADQESFYKLPREVQETLARREKERDTGWSKKADEYARREQDYKQQVEQLGQFQQLQQAARQNPLGFATQFLQSYGITPQQYLEALGKQPQVSPEVAGLYQQVNGLKQHLMQQQQFAQQQEQQMLENQVKSFAEAKDDSGAAIHPHFEAVVNDMMPLIGIVRQQHPELDAQGILKEAYERAVWANPETRQQLTQSQLQQAQRIAEKKLETAKAKKAGSPVNGRPGATTTKDKTPKSLEALVRHNLRVMSGG